MEVLVEVSPAGSGVLPDASSVKSGGLDNGENYSTRMTSSAKESDRLSLERGRDFDFSWKKSSTTL